jgi:hypothetical protein
MLGAGKQKGSTDVKYGWCSDGPKRERKSHNGYQSFGGSICTELRLCVPLKALKPSKVLVEWVSQGGRSHCECYKNWWH